MFRKFTAVIQLMLMLVVVATSQPSLSFCLCAHEFYVGECSCNTDVIVENDDLKPSSEHIDCCQGHCSSKQERTDTFNTLQSQPCSDCVVDLSINFEDFTLSHSDLSKHSNNHFNAVDFIQLADFDIPNKTCETTINGIRGSPPSLSRAHPTPLFIRHSAYLL